MARIDNLSLTRSLQADGWWYRVADDTWTRMWDDEVQYGRIRDSKFERFYPDIKKEPKQSLKETLLNQGWTYQMHEDRFYRNELGGTKYGRIVDGEFVRDDDVKPQTVQFSQVMDPNNFGATMADVGETIQNGSPNEAEAMRTMSMMDDEQWRLEVDKSLRDQFAMHAMGGHLACKGLFASDAKSVAIQAYEYADAMMIAREMNRADPMGDAAFVDGLRAGMREMKR